MSKCNLCGGPLDHDIDDLKTTKEVKELLKMQMDMIRELTGLGVELDSFGDDKEPFLLELNYYVGKKQHPFTHHGHSFKPEELCAELQDIIDVLYVTKYRKPRPPELGYFNKYPIKPMTKKQREKLRKSKLYVPLK